MDRVNEDMPDREVAVELGEEVVALASWLMERIAWRREVRSESRVWNARRTRMSSRG